MEIALADKLGVSRTPIREAIRKLELEGLVVMAPRKGAKVASITERDLNDVLEVRKGMEVLAVSLACQRITKEELDKLEEHPNIDGLMEAIQWHNLYKLADMMGNVLETVTIPKYPVIQEIKDHMKEHGALNAMMSGSGPTVFGLFDDKHTAEQACEALRASHLAKTVFLTTVFNNGGRRK